MQCFQLYCSKNVRVLLPRSLQYSKTLWFGGKGVVCPAGFSGQLEKCVHRPKPPNQDRLISNPPKSTDQNWTPMVLFGSGVWWREGLPKKKKQHTPHPVLLAWDEVYQMATIWWGCWDPVRWGCSNSTSLSIIPDTISPTGLQYSLYMWTLIFYFGEDISACLLQPERCRLVWKLFELAGWKKSKQKLIV